MKQDNGLLYRAVHSRIDIDADLLLLKTKNPSTLKGERFRGATLL
jgi:hypothetical protein